MTTIEEFLHFANVSSTMFHAAENVRKMCVNFIELKEGEAWHLEKGKSYVVSRNGSSVIAFSIGKNLDQLAFNICASHTDSPCFKLKENGEVEMPHALKGNVEGYGGMIVNTWLDRPLKISGRVFVQSKGRIESMLYDSKTALCAIPNVAIHMNRKLNDGYVYNLQTDMMPLLSEESKKGALKKRICEDLNLQEENLLSCDLYLNPFESGKIWGLENEFFSAPRIDNLESVYCTFKAFLNAENDTRINVCAAFDNEEVGSNTKQGADSTFLSDVLKRIQIALGYTDDDYLCALAHSMMLSVDNAHALHPNHPEFSDATNAVFMNQGVVVKSNANQQYTSDALSVSLFRTLCERVNVPVQFFVNKSDIRGGSTLGNISSSHLSIKSVDIGCAQLAMHSANETAGVKDVEYMIQACQAFYESSLKEVSSNCWEI